ncbi:PREDICTED: uncharacterized protein LOC100633395 [Amphimedon queenslandica]|uniref:Tumor protein p53-inducible nuclear protein 1 n=1 Tax=Amphimedon queenslandica TaxID=400682 RepID=A0A1X7UC05_AMPQE|nr:PREDICTED: uncharacterized protein LOC100633395 [Amphimedon queenslandica]|eukprot:XP_003388402.1 PREDICTED: uncharacterized protein LOC100633395 [Amphimedon queenslandica]
MLPSFVSNLIWGAADEDRNSDDGLCTVTEEKDGDWLVIDYDTSADAGENESTTSETSVSSWIVAPSPRFRSSSNAPSLDNHSVENLLLENPSMSVYGCQVTPVTNEETQESKNKQLVPYDMHRRQIVRYSQNNRQLVLLRRQEQQELANQMGIPLEPFVPEKPCESAPIPCPIPKLSKKALKKHNNNNIRITRGKKCYKIHQCGVKAGRRRS